MVAINLSPELHVRVEKYDLKAFFFGKSGEGKTNTSKACAIDLLAGGVPPIIIDPMGEFYPLITELGLPIVWVAASKNEDAHIHITSAESARALAEWVFYERVPILLDTSEMTQQIETDFVAKFLEAFWAIASMQSKRAERPPFCLIIDEAHLFVPEGSKTPSTQTILDIARMGRHYNLMLIGASQRPANVQKTFIGQCQLIISHRVKFADADYLADNALGINKKQLNAIMKRFHPGDCVVVGDRKFVDTGDEDYLVTRIRAAFRSDNPDEQPLVLPSLGTIDEGALNAIREALTKAIADGESEGEGRCMTEKERELLRERNDLRANLESVTRLLRAAEQDIIELRDALANPELLIPAPTGGAQASENGNVVVEDLISISSTKFRENGHSSVAPVTTDKGIAKQQRAFDQFLFLVTTQQVRWQIDMMLYLAHFDLQNFNVTELSRRLGVSRTTILQNPPTWFMKNGLISRRREHGDFIYFSQLRQTLQQKFPDLETEVLIKKLWQHAGSRVMQFRPAN